MAKSKSQRMKEYRARKKEQLGEQYLKQERERVKSYYIPTAALSKVEKQKRRERNRKNFGNFYRKKKSLNEVKRAETINQTEYCEQDQEITSTSNLLTVKLASITKRNKKTTQNHKLKRQISVLENSNKNLKKKLKTAQKKIQRIENRRPKMTPRSKTDSMLKKSGINPKSVPEVRKQLIFSECINTEIQETILENPSNIRLVQKVVSGQILKKYRFRSYLEKLTKVGRRKHQVSKDLSQRKRFKLRDRAEKVKAEVTEFLCRDDNSRVLPGKADAVKTEGYKHQKRVLNDYMNNLYLKFKAEASYTISRATFHRLRPKYVSLVNFASRSVCLCSKHQNFGFKLRALKNLNVCTCTSPDSFVDQYKNDANSLEEMLNKISVEKVKFQQWKRVKLQNGKERMRIIDIELSREEFIQNMKSEFKDFMGHVERVIAQYTNVKRMRENLPKNQVLVQMDFSENYNCQTMEEIQSAYWNASMVTLHPVILYYKDEDDTINHRSFVYVSEILNHNAGMVAAIIEKITSSAKEIVTELQYIHFWTDSPSSQYRNKSIFDLVLNFETKFGCKASWHYFESGHGKSACDGIGGTTKRSADNAVKIGTAVIQDANDFYSWASNTKSDISYVFVTAEEYEKSNKEIEQRKVLVKPLKGTMSLHAIAVDKNNDLIVRKTTCACEKCFEGEFDGGSTCVWEITKLRYAQSETAPETNEESVEEREVEVLRQESNKDLTDAENKLTESSTEKFDVNINDFVVATYDRKCYIGKILEIDDDDDTVNVTFMRKSGKISQRFTWPQKEDKLWIEREDVVCTIDNPTATGKTGRIFSVADRVLRMMEMKEQSFK